MPKEKLIFNYLVEQKRYELITQSGKPLSDVVSSFIKTHKVNLPILTEADYKTIWSHRTAINGLLKEITDARKQTCAVVVNPLLDACKPLEKMLQDASNELTEKMLAFKPKEGKPKTTTIITIELPIDSELVKKVKTYLKRSKIAYEEENE